MFGAKQSPRPWGEFSHRGWRTPASVPARTLETTAPEPGLAPPPRAPEWARRPCAVVRGRGALAPDQDGRPLISLYRKSRA